MLIRIRRHLTYANVVSSLCLFVLLGGSAYAAAKITGKNVKNGSLTGRDVKNNSLTGKDVKRLGAGDLKAGALPKGPAGPAGPAGPGAKRIFVDTGVNVKAGIVFNSKDFDVSVTCDNASEILITRHAPANVALNGTEIHGPKNSTSTATQPISDFLDGSPGAPVPLPRDHAVIATAGTGIAAADVTVQSYLPGSDTRHAYTVVANIVDEGGSNCAAYGSVTPAS